ncbi:Mobile element protein, partial [Cytobacillus firmus]
SAEEISEMYKSRWAIELFFKWIKQHLNIKKFYGYSPPAYRWGVFNAYSETKGMICPKVAGSLMLV